MNIDKLLHQNKAKSLAKAVRTRRLSEGCKSVVNRFTSCELCTDKPLKSPISIQASSLVVDWCCSYHCQELTVKLGKSCFASEFPHLYNGACKSA